MLGQHHSHGHGGRLTATSPFGHNTSSAQNQTLQEEHQTQVPWNGSFGHSENQPPPNAGEKRLASTAVGYGMPLQAHNKRYCTDPSYTQASGVTELNNPRKRTSSGVQTVPNHSPAPLNFKKAKTEMDSDETEDSAMDICQDKPKETHRDAAIDVWNFIGVG